MAQIELEHLTKVFPGGTVAVEDVNLRVEDGEFMVLVGPSGCGKSTLLRMIAGLEEVTDGHIRVGGRDVTDLAPRRRDVAMVFQSYALYPHMSVRQNIGYGLKVRKTPKAETKRRVEEVGRFFDAPLDLLLGPLAQLQAEGHVVVDRHVRVERVGLEHHCDVPVLRCNVIHQAVADVDVTGGDLLQASDHAQGRALAAAGRPDQHQELAVLDLDVEVCDGGHLAVLLGNVVQQHASHMQACPSELMPGYATG